MVLSTAPMIRNVPRLRASCHARLWRASRARDSEFCRGHCVHGQAGAKRRDPASATSRFRHMVEEYPCALGPGHAEREVAAFIPRAIECVETCAPQIVVENADR